MDNTLKRICTLAIVSAMGLSACSAANSSSGTHDAPAATAAPAPAAAPAAAAPADHKAAEGARAEEAVAGEAFGETVAAAPAAEYYADDAVADADGDYEAVYEEAPVTTAAMMAETEAAIADEEYEEFTSAEVNNGIRAGQLTAGEWNDNENWGFFTNLVNAGRINYPAYGIDPRFRTAVTVKDPNGLPVVNATVTLFDEDKPSWTAVTDKEGIVYLFGRGNTLQITSGGTSRLYRFGEEEQPQPEETTTVTTVAETTAETERTTFHDQLEIVLRSGTAEILGEEAAQKIFGSKVPEIIPEESPAMEVVAEQYIQDKDPFISNEVDVVFDGAYETYPDMQIMFIVDTTGSMGDELMFLQSEFSAIAEKIGTDHAEYSVNFYKDHGDKYVTRTNSFSSDIKDINRIINSETASGGGDNPEAVSEILDECMHSQEWRGDTVKLAFLIFDAPPHDDPESLRVLEKAMKTASAQGIRVIPVVSSNTERETELFGRGLAIFTGGTYVFLTDDSGIGGSHLEPIIGSYEVESLYDLIVRLIEEYRQ